MSSFVSSIVFLFFVSFALIEGVTLQKNSSSRFKKPKVAGKESTCEWPGEFLLADSPALDDREGFDKWLKKIQPQAFRDWMQCSEPISNNEAIRKMREMKKVFEDSGGVEELETRSGCGKSELMAIFDLKSSTKQIEHAATCIVDGMKKPLSRFSVIVRVDENCERNRRNIIRGARNAVIAAAAATAAAGICCAAYTPLSPACCASLPGLIAADAAAIAALASARQFECPKCSDPPSAKMVTGHDKHEIPVHYLTDGGSGKLALKVRPGYEENI